MKIIWNAFLPRIVNDNLLGYFNIRAMNFIDEKTSILFKRYALDIFKFNKWLHKEHGYEEEKHGSIKDFITLKFSKEAKDFIEQII